MTSNERVYGLNNDFYYVCRECGAPTRTATSADIPTIAAVTGMAVEDVDLRLAYRCPHCGAVLAIEDMDLVPVQ